MIFLRNTMIDSRKSEISRLSLHSIQHIFDLAEQIIRLLILLTEFIRVLFKFLDQNDVGRLDFFYLSLQFEVEFIKERVFIQLLLV